MDFEALDIVIPIDGGDMMTIISVERGLNEEHFYCVNKKGAGNWFKARKIRIARTSDFKITERKSRCGNNGSVNISIT
jgi:hypothetical protein